MKLRAVAKKSFMQVVTVIQEIRIFSRCLDLSTLVSEPEVGQVVYIPGAADIRNENTNHAESTAMSKEEKILEYIRQNGSISSQDTCTHSD